MKLFQKLIESNTPFSVIKYKEWLAFNKENTNTVYELLTVGVVKGRPFIMNGKSVVEHKNILKGKILSEKEIMYFKSVKNKFLNVSKKHSENIWEFNNFKKHVTGLNVEY